MNKITITVSGETATGKTSIAVAIGRTLEFYHGFNVKYENIDAQLELDSHDMEHHLDDLAEKTEIVISEINVRRENGLPKV